MHQPSPYDPDDDFEPDDLEVGTPVYQGTGLSVRALSPEELDRFLDAHANQPAQLLGSGWDTPEPTTAGPVASGWPAGAPAGASAPRGSYGSPGRSALARYRRERARELAAWSRSLPWWAALALAAMAAGAVLAGAAGLHRAALLLAGLTAGGMVGWRLRFRPSLDTRAWRDGAQGERATARLLRRLTHHGFVVFHDVAIPGTPANADHGIIGPGGVVLVDSKRYTGRVWQGPDGRVWHNQYPMDRPLRSLRMETTAIAELLGVPVRPLVCVHGARVDFAGLVAGDVEIVPAGRLRTVLTLRGEQLHEPEVAVLTAHARTMLRPA